MTKAPGGMVGELEDPLDLKFLDKLFRNFRYIPNKTL